MYVHVHIYVHIYEWYFTLTSPVSLFLNFNPFTSTRSWLRQGLLELNYLFLTGTNNPFHHHDGSQNATFNSLLFLSRLTLSANRIRVSSKDQIHTCQGHANLSCIIPSQTTVMLNPQERSNCWGPNVVDGRTWSVDVFLEPTLSDGDVSGCPDLYNRDTFWNHFSLACFLTIFQASWMSTQTSLLSSTTKARHSYAGMWSFITSN